MQYPNYICKNPGGTVLLYILLHVQRFRKTTEQSHLFQQMQNVSTVDAVQCYFHISWPCPPARRRSAFLCSALDIQPLFLDGDYHVSPSMVLLIQFTDKQEVEHTCSLQSLNLPIVSLCYFRMNLRGDLAFYYDFQSLVPPFCFTI